MIFDSDINRTERAIRKSNWLAKDENKKDIIQIQDFSSNELEIEYKVSHITRGDYKRLDNLDEVSPEFQPANPVVFDIKNCVFNSMKDNQFLEKESEDYKAHQHLKLFRKISEKTINMNLKLQCSR